MPLSPGDKLGPYEIIAPIGKGGMGEVYKARDTRLDRIIALKVSDAQFSERFEREAKAIAALNHPNICTLHDVGPNYLVMEYIEGAPLKGPMPVDQALKYAAQICDALDAAHKKGITHRDLKPANILVAGIKLLDFGLAKLETSGIGQAPKPDDATLTMALTGKNEIVGTLYYMSPEQLQSRATGKEIDARSDIFSFGIVLYEMLTGKRAFEGASPASVIAAIMERPAPSITDVAPAALDRLLKRCLAKDPDDRWQTARDLKAELEWIASSSGHAAAALTPVARRSLLPWIAAAVMTLIAALGLAGWYRGTRPPELKPLVRLDVDLGAGAPRAFRIGADAIISPDGTRLVYAALGKLFTRRLDQPNAAELAGTEGAFSPFFSPDGQWVAFFAAGKLKKVSVEGSAVTVLCSAVRGSGGSWGEDGNIIASLTIGGALSRIPSAGGEPTSVTELANGEVTHHWPQILPGGQAVLFTGSPTTGTYEAARIEVISLRDHRRKRCTTRRN
jgi:serine/threonine-protein kinase